MRSVDGLQKVERPEPNRRDRQRHRVITRERHLCVRKKREGQRAQKVRRRTCSAPWPLTATKIQPLRPSGSTLFTGRFGQPMTPRTTSPWMTNARQTAYCPPRKNPFVPSMGSSAHRPIATHETRPRQTHQAIDDARPTRPP